MVPIYGIVSFFSYVFYQDALYFELIRGQSTTLPSAERSDRVQAESLLSSLDCYEAFVIASFFYLLLAFLGETEQEVKEVFRDKHLDQWMW